MCFFLFCYQAWCTEDDPIHPTPVSRSRSTPGLNGLPMYPAVGSRAASPSSRLSLWRPHFPTSHCPSASFPSANSQNTFPSSQTAPSLPFSLDSHDHFPSSHVTPSVDPQDYFVFKTSGGGSGCGGGRTHVTGSASLSVSSHSDTAVSNCSGSTISAPPDLTLGPSTLISSESGPISSMAVPSSFSTMGSASNGVHLSLFVETPQVSAPPFSATVDSHASEGLPSNSSFGSLDRISVGLRAPFSRGMSNDVLIRNSGFPGSRTFSTCSGDLSDLSSEEFGIGALHRESGDRVDSEILIPGKIAGSLAIDGPSACRFSSISSSVTASLSDLKPESSNVKLDCNLAMHPGAPASVSEHSCEQSRSNSADIDSAPSDSAKNVFAQVKVNARMSLIDEAADAGPSTTLPKQPSSVVGSFSCETTNNETLRNKHEIQRGPRFLKQQQRYLQNSSTSNSSNSHLNSNGNNATAAAKNLAPPLSSKKVHNPRMKRSW